ncbi:TIGR02594 family protein [Shinella sp. BYT-45]|uniref:TIGR02594 family protein n=1 Tax=Shinella sp. BYT-45 TaxID=3377377 RepID=UPI00397FCC9F
MTFEQWVISRLLANCAYAGAVDGAPGRKMIEALERFQRAEGLPVTGMANAATVEALRRTGPKSAPVAAPAVPAEPVWMREARRHMGLREIAGKGSNATIMSWAKRLGGWVASFFTDDDIPWCGLAVAAWIAITLPKEALPANPLGALNWKKFGIGLSTPALGAVLVFTRSGGGHVGLYVGEDNTHFHVLGGNQSNSVSITRIEKGRLVAVRWPSTGGNPAGGRVHLSSKGVPVTRNEA